MGVKLRKLRAERGMSQIALAHALGLSPSYLNQIEQNPAAPHGVGVARFHHPADIQEFEDDEARLIAGLKERICRCRPGPAALPELQEVAAQMPALGQAVLALHRLGTWRPWSASR